MVGVPRSRPGTRQPSPLQNHKSLTSPAGSPGATHGTANIFPKAPVDNFGYSYRLVQQQNSFLSSSSYRGTPGHRPTRFNRTERSAIQCIPLSGRRTANGHVFVTLARIEPLWQLHDVRCHGHHLHRWHQQLLGAVDFYMLNPSMATLRFLLHPEPSQRPRRSLLNRLQPTETGCSNGDSRVPSDFSRWSRPADTGAKHCLSLMTTSPAPVSAAPAPATARPTIPIVRSACPISLITQSQQATSSPPANLRAITGAQPIISMTASFVLASVRRTGLVSVGVATYSS